MNKGVCGKLILAAGVWYGLGAPYETDAAEQLVPRGRARATTRTIRPVNPVSPVRQIQYEESSRSSTPAPQPSLADENSRTEAIQELATEPATAIDLSSALRLAGIQNLDLVVAQQRVEAAVADQQYAAAQILPSLNLGTNFNSHTGVVQQATGNILAVNRSALYVGAGANAVAAGTVSIPGLQYNLNVSESIYSYLVAKKLTEVSEREQRANYNDVLLRVAVGYTDLLAARGLHSLTILTRNDAREVARLTAAFAQAGEGRPADAERAATELARREEDRLFAEAQVAQASFRLCQVLNIEATTRLIPVESQVIPQPVVPTQIPLPELLAIALLERPEMQARRGAIEAALLELDSAKVLPFSPQLIAGLSGGAFGGGSNLTSGPEAARFGVGPGAPRFGRFQARSDVDLVLYWSLRNLGLGNKALIDLARSRLCASQFAELVVFDRVRREVAEAYMRTHARFAEIDRRAAGIRVGMNALLEDLVRIRGREGLPIEALDSLRQLARARQDYLDAIAAFNRAEFELYVALGTPPADTLARPVPQEFGSSAGDVQEGADR